MTRPVSPTRRSPAAPRWRRVVSEERGAEVVEFALASLLFFGLIFGVVQAGFTVYGYNRLAVVAQEGARYAAVRGTRSQGSFATGGTKAAITTYLQGLEPSITQVVFDPDVNPNTLAPGATIQVTVRRPLPGYLVVGNWTGTMSATASMLMMR